MIRKNYFVLKGMQTRFVLTVLLIGVLVFAVAALNLYMFHVYLQSEVLSLAEDSQFREVLVKAWDMLKWRFFLLGLVTLVIGGYLTLLLSHQVAGPAYKICQHLERIRDGKLNSTIKLRNYDELTNIANAINDLTVSLGAKLQAVKDASESCGDGCQEVREAMEGFILPEESDLPDENEENSDDDDRSGKEV